MRISPNLHFNWQNSFPLLWEKCLFFFFFIPHSFKEYLCCSCFFHGVLFLKAVSPCILPSSWCWYIRVTPTSMVFRIVISFLSFLIHGLSFSSYQVIQYLVSVILLLFKDTNSGLWNSVTPAQQGHKTTWLNSPELPYYQWSTWIILF